MADSGPFVNCECRANTLAPTMRRCWGGEVDDAEFSRLCAVLGVGPDVTCSSLDQAHVRRSFALIRSGSETQKAELRAAYEALSGELQRRESLARRAAAPAVSVATETKPEQVDLAPREPEPARFDPCSFDSRVVNATALPLILGLAWVLNASPLGMMLRGFHVWMHEFGHATVAWMSGYRALPLPIGWTNVEPEKANFVYFGVLFLLAVMAVAGWRERKIWAVLLPLALAPVQYYMTWRMPEHRYELWMAFGGVGGEFYLSAALMALFFVHLPDKFRWGACRYVAAFLGASAFLNVWLFWRRVAHFEETIPYGSMVNGEDDANGDMNVLRLHGWRETHITQAYTNLGFWCLVALALVYLIFVLRLDRTVGRWMIKLWPEGRDEGSREVGKI